MAPRPPREDDDRAGRAVRSPPPRGQAASGKSHEKCPRITKRTIASGVKIRKRAVQRPPTQQTDIYVSTKSAPAGQLERAKTLLLEKKHPTITIHGLGAAAERAVSLALRLKVALQGRVDLRTTTSTVSLVDDVVPDDDAKDLDAQALLETVKSLLPIAALRAMKGIPAPSGNRVHHEDQLKSAKADDRHDRAIT